MAWAWSTKVGWGSSSQKGREQREQRGAGQSRWRSAAGAEVWSWDAGRGAEGTGLAHHTKDYGHCGQESQPRSPETLTREGTAGDLC